MSDDLLVLVCAIPTCRWRPPADMEVSLLEAHFDLEEGHDPANIHLELVAWCRRCNVEMNLDRSEHLHDGRVRHHYSCRACHRRGSCIQTPEKAGGDDDLA